jgi:hypothetical protein
MRSWLSSPSVLLLSFLATVITVVQWLVVAARRIHRMSQTVGERQRSAFLVGVAGLAAVAIISPLTWTAIWAEAVKTGNHGLIGALYPVMVDGSGLAAALVLLLDAREGFQLPLRIFFEVSFLLVGSLAVAAVVYIFHDQNGTWVWSRGAVSVIPGVMLAMLIPLMIGRAGHALAARTGEPGVRHTPATAKPR